MSKKPNRSGEAEIAVAVLQIAASAPGGLATFARLKREIPNYVQLSVEDQAQSDTRPNEEMWEQIIRNIRSHHDVPGNIICEGYVEHVPRAGYRITEAGIRWLKTKKLI